MCSILERGLSPQNIAYETRDFADLRLLSRAIDNNVTVGSCSVCIYPLQFPLFFGITSYIFLPQHLPLPLHIYLLPFPFLFPPLSLSTLSEVALM